MNKILMALGMMLAGKVFGIVPDAREFRGPFPIMSIAYHEDGSLDCETLVKEAQYVDDCGCPGVIWCQSDDAVDFLTIEEKARSYDAVGKGMQGRNAVLVFGCRGRPGTDGRSVGCGRLNATGSPHGG